MAIYRIKQDRSLLEPPEQSQEYWREAKPGQESDLDFDEIRELNENIPEQEDELEPIPRFRSPWLTVLLGVVLILSFMICIGYSLFPQRFDFSLLIRSAEMAQDASLAALQQAVVKVETPSGGGSGFNIRPEGLIVTNAHVVEDRGFLTITFPESAGGQVFITKEYILIDLIAALPQGARIIAKRGQLRHMSILGQVLDMADIIQVDDGIHLQCCLEFLHRGIIRSQADIAVL